jgi:hypothetical protein
MSAQQPKDYTQRFKGSGKTMSDKLPDDTVHLPPIALFALGGIGVLAGLATNCWQVITTFVAFWSMFNPKAKPVDFQRQPVLFAVCGLIAFSFQLALMFLVFRLDKAWKKNKAQGGSGGSAAKDAVVEIVQQTDLVLIWSLLGFVVDTIGDYTFISLYTGSTDTITAIFLIFIYAVALYALSTIGFVRSLEYVWSGFAAVARQVAGASK